MVEFSYVVNIATKIQKMDSLQELQKSFNKEIQSLENKTVTCVSLAGIATQPPDAIFLYIAKPAENDPGSTSLSAEAANEDHAKYENLVINGSKIPSSATDADGYFHPKDKEEKYTSNKQKYYLITGHENSKIVQTTYDNNSHTDLPKLSPREKECLHWAAKGLSDQDIGELLSLAPSTVTSYMKNVRDKFKVRTRIQAVVIATSYGLISP